MRSETDHETSTEGPVRLRLHFDAEGLELTPTPMGLVVALDGVNSGGDPGAPALPRTRVRVAVPEGFWPTGLWVAKAEWTDVTHGPELVAPAQRPRAGAGRRKSSTTRDDTKHDDQENDDQENDDQQHDEDRECGGRGGRCGCTCGCADEREQEPRWPVSFDPPEVVAPDEGLYAAAMRTPRELVGAVGIESAADVHVAVIEVNPMRLSPEGVLQLCTLFELEVAFDRELPLQDRDEAHKALEAQLGRSLDPEHVVPLPRALPQSTLDARLGVETLAHHVLNPELVTIDLHQWPRFELPADYLIITDDRRWDAATITAGAPLPGMVAAFRRLADWKRARGVSAKVVTITDIVGGRYGDHRSGSRDLQEVLRRFLKRAKAQWGVQWLLLGGDIEVVPMRSVAGPVEGRVWLDSKATPDDNRAFWTGAFLKMHVVSPGTWWGASSMNTLVNHDSGAVIAYDASGTSSATSPGWFFTTDDTYTTRTAGVTEFVRVNGPAGLVNASLQFLYAWNQIPTDFYYASLQSWVVRTHEVAVGFGLSFQIPYVFVPEHDWDAAGNGVYGQSTESGVDLDGVLIATDLSVGRAPASSATDATTFVDKVIAYEQYGGLGTIMRPLDGTWPLKMLLASTDWGGDLAVCSPTASLVPAESQYHHLSSQNRSLLHVGTVPDPGVWTLVAEVSATDRRRLPYTGDDAPGVRGWYFAKGPGDLSRSGVVLPWFVGGFYFPIPTPWVVVQGSVADRTPQDYLFDATGQDGSMSDQEELRRQMGTDFPQVDQYSRVYEDDLDLTFFERLVAPVRHMTGPGMRAALDAAPHFVSLSGHGSSDGCCWLSRGVASSLTNGRLGFIAFADSCLTNQVDDPWDACSEILLNNPNGGAVAYVGNTRFSWIGVGDNFQRAFFHRLTSTRHLGLLNDTKVSVYGTSGYRIGYDRWVVYAQNLLGCPEMPVLRNRVRSLVIRVVNPRLDLPLEIYVEQPPVGPPGPPPELRDTVVRVRQGELDFAVEVDALGRAVVAPGVLSAGPVEITATHVDTAPAQVVLDLPGSPCCDDERQGQAMTILGKA